MKERMKKRGHAVNVLKARRKSVTLSEAQVRIAIGPIVYIFWDYAGVDNRRALYVGRSLHGVSRPFSPEHHMAEIRELCYEIELIPCRSHQEATNMEMRLIRELRPKHNKFTPRLRYDCNE